MMQNYYHQPKEGDSIGNFLYAVQLPKNILITYEGGFAYINPKLFPQWFASELITSPDPFFPNYLVEYWNIWYIAKHSNSFYLFFI
jgi:hypothetical protein